ncbi:AGXT [Bugula neritina]|uniref:alanine--glyoxylate transaminase n=1 Tax=Bugula neritina TaxID=10212 RepID=A0A7J7JTT4_BUGNE|nr:AGXT [Bugula neritina]
MDLSELANYWGCDGAPARRYHHTAPITSVYQLREALALATEEGLENMWKRHSACSAQLREGVKKLGLSILINEPEHILPTLTGVMVPQGVDWKAVTGYLMKNYRIEISGGLGYTAGQIWRIGLMGYNARPDAVDTLLRAFKEALEAHGYTPSKM